VDISPIYQDHPVTFGSVCHIGHRAVLTLYNQISTPALAKRI
jgi:hypothetical protein